MQHSLIKIEPPSSPVQAAGIEVGSKALKKNPGTPNTAVPVLESRPSQQMAMPADVLSSGRALAACCGEYFTAWNAVEASQPGFELQSNLLRTTDNTQATTMQFLPVGLLIGTAGGTIDLHRKVTEFVASIPGASNPVQLSALKAIKFFKDTKTLAIASAKQIIAANMSSADLPWDVCEAHRAPISAIAGSRLSSGIEVLAAARSPIMSLDFSPTEPAHLASAALDGTLSVWSLTESFQHRLHLFGGKHTDLVKSIRFSPTSAHVLYTCSLDRQVLVWDRRTNTQASATQQVSMPLPITCLSVRHDGVHVAVGAPDGHVHLLDARKLSTPYMSLQCKVHQPVLDVQWQPSWAKQSKRSTATEAVSATKPVPQVTPAPAPVTNKTAAPTPVPVPAQATTKQDSGAATALSARQVPTPFATSTPAQPQTAPNEAHPPTQVVQPVVQPRLADAVKAAAVVPPLTAGRITPDTHTASAVVPMPAAVTASSTAISHGAQLGATTTTGAADKSLAERVCVVGGGVEQTGDKRGGDDFKAYFDSVINSLKEDIHNMHVEVVRQFHIQQMGLEELVHGVARQQDQLVAEMRGLKQQMDKLARAQALQSWMV